MSNGNFCFAYEDANVADGGLSAVITSDGSGGAFLTVTSYPPINSSSGTVGTNLFLTIPNPALSAPEPGTVILLGSALAGLGLLRRFRRA